MNTDY